MKNLEIHFHFVKMLMEQYGKKQIQKSCRRFYPFSNFCIFIQKGLLVSTGISFPFYLTGIQNQKVEPCPKVLCTPISPSQRSMIALQIERPRPVP